MHRTRDLLVKQRTQSVNMMRGLLAEFGVDIPEGLERALMMARQVIDGEVPDVPAAAVKMVGMLSQQALDTHAQLREIDRALANLQRTDEVARRLATIPGIGPVSATSWRGSCGPCWCAARSTRNPTCRSWPRRQLLKFS